VFVLCGSAGRVPGLPPARCCPSVDDPLTIR
jgi:hypothetical protein